MVNFTNNNQVAFAATNEVYTFKKESHDIVKSSQTLIYNTCCEHLNPLIGKVHPAIIKASEYRLHNISRSLAHAYESIYFSHTEGINVSKLGLIDKKYLAHEIFRAVVEDFDKMLTPDAEPENRKTRISTYLEDKYALFIKSGAITGVKEDLIRRIQFNN